jgi:dihydropteroate synthase
MGVLNVTPDSFSDGGRYSNPAAAVRRALEMVAQGADLLDVGGESSRPRAEPVDEAEELRRVLPVVEAVAASVTVPISVDTTKAEVARQAVKAGASIVNDISAMRFDSGMRRMIESLGAGVILMHMQGTPQTMQEAPRYGNVVQEVKAFLRSRLREAVESGIDEDRILLDPGIGFGKNLRQNLTLLSRLPDLSELGRPLCVGLSRKSFIGALTGEALPDRLPGSLSGAVVAWMRGAHVLRVHDVRETAAALKVAVSVTEVGDGSEA